MPRRLRRSRHAALRTLSLSLSLTLGAGSAAAQADARATPPPTTDPDAACAATVDWLHAATIPDDGERLGELIMGGQLAAHSVEWIGAAMAAAPPIGAWCERARQEQKLVFWYVPALEGQHDILTHLLHRYMVTGPLADPELAALLDAAFVSVQLPAGGELARHFGLTAPDVLEPVLLVLDDRARVLHRVDRLSSFDADVLAAWLRALLAEHGPGLKPPALADARARLAEQPDAEGRLELAGVLTTLGRWGEAEQVLTAEALATDDRAELARARLLREQRRGPESARLLDALVTRLTPPPPEPTPIPQPPEPGPPLLGEALVERGRLSLQRGELIAARDDLRHSLVLHDDGARVAEAGYWLGVTRWLLRREDLAVATWQRLVAEHPDSPWAATAEACARAGGDGYRGVSPLTRGLSDPRWKHADVYVPAADSSWRRGPEAAGDVVDRALEVLVRSQRSDGRWAGPRWGGQGEGFDLGALGNIDMAIAASACLALHAWRDRHPGADQALRRGEAFLMRDELVDREATAWPYADGFRLIHGATRLPELPGAEAAALRGRMQGWVDGLLAQQEELGGPFSHFTYTSTFVTAFVARCLRLAADAGVQVPDSAFERAADALESARGPEGRFGYLMDHPFVGRSVLGAGARQPLCEEALSACGRDRSAAYAASLDVFLTSYDGATERARKANFHIPALDQVAGYFFFHDLLPACRVAMSSGPRSDELRDALLRRLCQLPEWDGSFIDSGHSYGKGYGTAMALLCLAALEVE